MVLVRNRYRRAPIQPELTDGKEGVSLSLAKQEIPKEEDPLEEFYATAWEEPALLPAQTQQQRTVTTTTSSEVEYRKKHYPTIHERVEQQKQWAQQQLQATKIATQKAALKRAVSQKKLQATLDPSDENMARYEKELAELLRESEEQLMNMSKDAAASEHVAKQLQDLREKKVMTGRNPSTYHKQYSKWQLRRIAISVKLGLYRKTQGEASVVLPWLLVGRRELATDMQKLMTLGVTHILNMTHDCPNMFPNSFVYQQVPIRDATDTDLTVHFNKIVGFIQRAESCKGRILVHCTAGASRAPSAVLSYLLIAKKLPLLDAYNYITYVRSVVQPNQGFLFQLAMLEVKLAGCSSVYYHEDWRFYAFNMFRAEGLPGRKSLGMYSAVMQLFDKAMEVEGTKEMKDLFSQE